jgi:hypothetical protein
MAMPYVHRSNILFKVVCIVNGKKLLGIVAAGVVIFFVVAQPHEAAGLVHTIIGMLKDGAGQLVTFLKGVIHGNG